MSDYNVQTQQEDDEIVIDLGVLFVDLWKGFKKFWWVILIICSLAAGLSYAGSIVTYSPMYASKVSFTVSTQIGKDDANTSYSFYYNTSTAEQLEKLLPYVLESDVMQGLLQEELNTEQINGSVSASAIPNSNLFTMKAVSSDPLMAQQILEATLKHLPDVTRYIIGETQLNIIQPVTTPEMSYNRPNYIKKVIVGFLAGAVVSCGLLVVYALFRHTIRKEEDFRTVLNIKCLGLIPRVRFKSHKKEIDQTISVSNLRIGHGIKESFRSLSLKLQRRMDEEGKKILMVTSACPQEGKSTVSMNLAKVFSERGKRVLLVDMDLRNPSLADRLQAPDELAGIEEILQHKAGAEKAICELERGLYFMGGRQPVQKASTLLANIKIGEVLRDASRQVDYVIVDTPPCGLMADASILSRCCDATLYVVYQDRASRSQVIEGMQNVMRYGTPIIGGVLNGTEGHMGGEGKYGYGKYGYGKYGYGKYGYGKYGYGRYGYGRHTKKPTEQ